MYILSIDVGIKNLAYCLFFINDNKCLIKEWKTVSLLKPLNLCSCLKNNNNKCQHIATYEKNNIFYCKRHTKTCDYIIETPEYNINKLKRLKLSDLLNFADKHYIEYSFPITKSQLFQTIDIFLKEKLISKIKHTSSNDISIITLGKEIMNKFNPLLSKYNIDCVLIENQMGKVAVRMKTLQGMITQYFIMNDIFNIEYISSANKLKFFINNKKTTYTERKNIGIDTTKTIIRLNKYFNEWEPIIDSLKKKDDLCDSFLQGIWYIINHKYFSINY